jgi:hypothetical protein
MQHSQCFFHLAVLCEGVGTACYSSAITSVVPNWQHLQSGKQKIRKGEIFLMSPVSLLSVSVSSDFAIGRTAALSQGQPSAPVITVDKKAASAGAM